MPRKASNKRTGSSTRRTKRVQRGGGRKNTPVGEAPKPAKGLFGRLFGGKAKPSIISPINPYAKMNTAFEQVRRIAGTEAGSQERYMAAANIGKLVSSSGKSSMFNVTSGNAIRASPNPNTAARAIMKAVNPKAANQREIYLKTNVSGGSSNV